MEEICDTPANNYLAKTTQEHALMRLGRQSAERERVSEISWNFFKKNCRQTHFRNCLQAIRERIPNPLSFLICKNK
jgi:hypothetical protein